MTYLWTRRLLSYELCGLFTIFPWFGLNFRPSIGMFLAMQGQHVAWFAVPRAGSIVRARYFSHYGKLHGVHTDGRDVQVRQAAGIAGWLALNMLCAITQTHRLQVCGHLLDPSCSLHLLTLPMPMMRPTSTTSRNELYSERPYWSSYPIQNFDSLVIAVEMTMPRRGPSFFGPHLGRLEPSSRLMYVSLSPCSNGI